MNNKVTDTRTLLESFRNNVFNDEKSILNEDHLEESGSQLKTFQRKNLTILKQIALEYITLQKRLGDEEMKDDYAFRTTVQGIKSATKGEDITATLGLDNAEDLLTTLFGQ